MQRYAISTNGANKFSKTLIISPAVGRQQVVFGHSTNGDRVIFDPPHGRFLEMTCVVFGEGLANHLVTLLFAPP